MTILEQMKAVAAKENARARATWDQVSLPSDVEVMRMNAVRRRRETVLKMADEGVEYDRIAKLLGITKSTVWSDVSIARRWQ